MILELIKICFAIGIAGAISESALFYAGIHDLREGTPHLQQPDFELRYKAIMRRGYYALAKHVVKPEKQPKFPHHSDKPKSPHHVDGRHSVRHHGLVNIVVIFTVFGLLTFVSAANHEPVNRSSINLDIIETLLIFAYTEFFLRFTLRLPSEARVLAISGIVTVMMVILSNYVPHSTMVMLGLWSAASATLVWLDADSPGASGDPSFPKDAVLLFIIVILGVLFFTFLDNIIRRGALFIFVVAAAIVIVAILALVADMLFPNLQQGTTYINDVLDHALNHRGIKKNDSQRMRTNLRTAINFHVMVRSLLCLFVLSVAPSVLYLVYLSWR